MTSTSGTAWPPKELVPILGQVAEWSAWYSGSRDELERVGAAVGDRQQRTGLSGVIVRWWRRFWGAPVTDSSTLPKIKVHVPLATDIAAASADLLFGEPPTITAVAPDEATAEQQVIADATAARIAKYVEDGLVGVLAGAAETGAALGGVYLRVTWDMALRKVFISRIDTDFAIPVFAWGQLVSVTFWRRLAGSAGRDVYRHLEIHEIDHGTPDQAGTGNGIIRHQLWAGTTNDLGRQVPLTDHPATAVLAPLVDHDGDAITTHTPGLACDYIPNRTPNPLWRTEPCGADLGAPDIQGVEDLLDRLDHAYSSLLRELDLAKARIVLPQYMLDDLGPGQGQAFDADREIWVPLPGATAPSSGQQPMMPQLYQPQIRVDDHLRIMQQLVEDILRSAGYSAATFGEDEDGAQTATEVNSKTSRSRATRGRKIRTWQPALVRLVAKMLAVDVALGKLARAADPGSQDWADELVDPSLVRVEFPAPSQSPLELAQTAQALRTAMAASTETLVRLVHPGWDDAQVDEEVARVLAESGQSVQDPATFGQGGQGLEDVPQPAAESDDPAAQQLPPQP